MRNGAKIAGDINCFSSFFMSQFFSYGTREVFYRARFFMAHKEALPKQIGIWAGGKPEANDTAELRFIFNKTLTQPWSYQAIFSRYLTRTKTAIIMKTKIILALVSVSLLILTYYDASQNFAPMTVITLLINAVYWVMSAKKKA